MMNDNETKKSGLRAAANRLFSSSSSKKGSYSAGLTLAVVAIAAVLVLLVGLLPEDVKSIDISDDKVYSIGDVTTSMLSGLTNNISLTVVAEPDSLDSRIDRLVNQYTSRSERVTRADIDPIKDPAAVTALGASADTIIVTNEDNGRSATVSFDDILVVDPYSYYYYGTTDPTEFDGEGQLTGAINSVTAEHSERIYLTSGHGEVSLPAQITDRLTKLSLSTDSLSLLMTGSVPEDCTLLIINGPTSDFSEDEKTMLGDYLASGGGVMFVAGYETASLPNLQSLLSEYGITLLDGYVADLDRCYQGQPYYIFPVIGDAEDITSGFDSEALLMLIQSQGFELTEPERDTITAESFMTTSENGVIVTDTAQTQGQYVLGATATESVGEENKSARIVALSSVSVIEEQILESFPSLVNSDMYINCITWFMDGVSNVSIPSKSLQVTYNTVSGGAIWRALFVFIIPAAIIAGGLVIWTRRRKA